eukprot:8823-Hanusia_phi.AAC.1
MFAKKVGRRCRSRGFVLRLFLPSNALLPQTYRAADAVQTCESLGDRKNEDSREVEERQDEKTGGEEGRE